MSDLKSVPLKAPGRGRGILDAVKNRYLLRLLVDKEIQVRYRGSVLGILWSYIKPGVQFLVFYIAMGSLAWNAVCTTMRCTCSRA